MAERIIPFNELQEQVLDQLRDQGYMESTLTTYRRFYNRLHVFIHQCGTSIYTEEAGKEFLSELHVCSRTLSFYTCAVRRLNDFIAGNPYRSHHGNPSEKVAKAFSEILNGYLDTCRSIGNSIGTIIAKEKACISFLNFIEQVGCTDLYVLNAQLVSNALLIFDNKENYAQIRLFLKYAAQKGITATDLSGIVPRYKRRKVLPTTYTPNEITKVEIAVDTSTDTGKRNLAIIRLATRMGLRSGDIAKLKWSEIDFSTGYISIIQEKTRQPLTLQMPQEVSDALLSHLENLTRLPEDGYVFHSMMAPYGRITTSIIRHAVNNCFITAGINTTGKKHGPHAFRSSLASSMVNDGISYEAVRRILGHTDPDVIKHYARTDIENLRLCAIDPPSPSGLFDDYLSGKKVIRRV